MPVEQEAVEVRWSIRPAIAHSVANSEQDRDDRLKDESEAPWSRQAPGQILEKLFREQIKITALKRVPQRPWQRQYEHEQGQTRKDERDTPVPHRHPFRNKDKG